MTFYQMYFMRVGKKITRHHFERSHFIEAGAQGYAATGMPEVEALKLVNKWNALSGKAVFWV